MASSVDDSDLRRLVRDLSAAPLSVQRQVPGVISHAAVNIKKQMRAEMAASKHFKGVTPSITFDLVDAGLGADIGPVTGPGGVPGDLAFIAYFGTSRGGGTVPDPQGALDAEVPRLDRALGDLLGGLL
jgi:hypothetical protein